jgi:sec-independent protein translocase protein TatB
MFLFLGPTDMAAIFVVALLLFGPEQLPKVARQLGDAMRHMQNTTQSFMLEMDRAARETEVRPHIEPETALELPATEERSSEDPAGDSSASEGPPHVET